MEGRGNRDRRTERWRDGGRRDEGAEGRRGERRGKRIRITLS
jgi:hypothetical protein